MRVFSRTEATVESELEREIPEPAASAPGLKMCGQHIDGRSGAHAAGAGIAGTNWKR